MRYRSASTVPVQINATPLGVVTNLDTVRVALYGLSHDHLKPVRKVSIGFAPPRSLSERRPISVQLPVVYTLQRAWVGDMRAARSAGSSPATPPISTAAASPPAHATAGTTVVQWLVRA